MAKLTPEDVPHEVERLWRRIQNVAEVGLELRREKLDDADLAQFDALTRISSGYAFFLMECNSALEAGEIVEPSVIDDFGELIDEYCDSTINAFEWALRAQRGVPVSAVIVA